MKPTKLVQLALLALSFAAGQAAGAKTFVYVYDGSNPVDADPKIYGFESRRGLVGALAGSPFDVPGGPVDCVGQCQAIEYLKKRKVLVVSGPTGLSTFTVNKDGSLASVAGSPFGETDPLAGVAAVQVGKSTFVYSPESATGALHAFAAGEDGALTALASSPFTTALHAPGGATARKRTLFVADRMVTVEDGGPFPNALGVFTIGDDGTPAAAPGTPLEIVGATSVYSVAADAAGRFAYLADDASKADPIRVHGFAIAKQTGTPSLLAGSPFATLLGKATATGASVGPGLVAALAFEGVNDDLALFRSRKGVLAPLGSIADTGANVHVHTLVGKFLFAASEQSVQVVAIRKRDGATDRAPLVAFREDKLLINPVGIVVLNR